MSSLLVDADFDVGTYNDLRSVEDADTTVRADGENSLRTRFLREAGRVICAHDLETRFGIALLHQHYHCFAGERNVESEQNVAGERALIARPVSEPNSDESPTIWKLGGAKFTPVAMSTDPVARELGVGAEIPADFLEAFARLTAALHTEELFGLAVVERDLYRQAAETELPLEFSDIASRCSSTFLRPRSDERRNSIATSWTFEKTPDLASSCSTTTRCECWNIIGPPNHDHQPAQHHIVVQD